MFKLNKKLILLSLVLIAAIFLISACAKQDGNVTGRRLTAPIDNGNGGGNGGSTNSVCGNGIIEDGEVCDSNSIECVVSGQQGWQDCDNDCNEYGPCGEIGSIEEVTYQSVLDMLNSCESIEPISGVTNCNEVCGDNNKVCIKSDVAIYHSSINAWIVDTGATCSDTRNVNNVPEEGGVKYQCLCCSPPS